MKFRKLISLLPKPIAWVLLALVLSACASVTQTQEPVFDTSKINNILFRLDQDNELLTLTRDNQDVPQRIAQNLSGMGYAISSSDSTAHSHNLIAILGSINEGSTPPGLSFSAGNSNPRALNFQKAEVLPITCILTETENPDQISAELQMNFEAKNYLKYEKAGNHEREVFELLTNDMSTVCYNLLSGLNVPTQRRVNTEPTHASATSSPPETANASATPNAVESANTVDAPDTAATATTTPSQTSTWFPSVSYEIVTDPTDEDPKQNGASGEHKPQGKRIKADPRKRIVIKNHGSPMTFSFGHERK